MYKFSNISSILCLAAIVLKGTPQLTCLKQNFSEYNIQMYKEKLNTFLSLWQQGSMGCKCCAFSEMLLMCKTYQMC